MQAYGIRILVEQNPHLLLRQPDRFVLQFGIQMNRAILAFVNYQFLAFLCHFCVPCGFSPMRLCRCGAACITWTYYPRARLFGKAKPLERCGWIVRPSETFDGTFRCCFGISRRAHRVRREICKPPLSPLCRHANRTGSAAPSRQKPFRIRCLFRRGVSCVSQDKYVRCVRFSVNEFNQSGVLQ